MTTWTAAAEAALAALARASVQGALAIVAVWLLCRLVTRLPAAVRCWLWWLACARLVVGLVWASPVELPLLPPEAPVAATARLVPAPAPSTIEPVAVASPTAAPPPVRQVAVPLSWSTWAPFVATAWLAGLLVHLAIGLRQGARFRGALRRSTPVRDGRVATLAADLRRALGVGQVEVRRSPEVATPLVAGLVTPRVLLPEADLERLSDGELAMALCHELLHVRRGDLWLGWVPAAAERLYFFHPLARLAAREYALAREAACDAGVLDRLDAAPQAYGRLLLKLGVAPRAAIAGITAIAASPAGAAPSLNVLKRRLEMLQRIPEKARVRAGWWCLVALAALAAVVPFRLVAQQAEAAPEAPATPEAVEAAVAPVAPSAVVAAPATEAPVVAAVAVGATPAVAPVAPIAPVAVVAAAGGSSSYSYRTSSGDDDQSWVLLTGETSVIMSGSSWDVRSARKVRGSGDGELFWFQRDGKAWVVRDPATLAEIKELFKPQEELGERQSELGEKQSELGEKQSELGEKQSELGEKQSELGEKQAELAEQIEERQADDRSTADLDRQMDELGRLQGELGRKQGELGRQQGELGRQQGELGRRQGELGRQQGELARQADRQIRALMERAISDGRAQEVRD